MSEQGSQFNRSLNPRWFAAHGLSIVLALMLQSCGGKVADLSAGAGAVSQLSFTSTEIFGLKVGDVSTGIATMGGVSPLTFAVSTGALPDGVKLDPATGQIKGTIAPDLGGQKYLFSITVTDAAALKATQSFTGTIDAGNSALNLVTTKLGSIMAGINYSYPLLVVGGSSPYKYSVYTGSLPSGLTLDAASGVLSGKPAISTSGSTYAFGVQITDSASQIVKSDIFTGTVGTNPAGTVKITSTTLGGMQVGSVSANIATIGGPTPLSFAITGGTLPAGLSIDAATGIISGSLAATLANAAYAFAVTATDASGATSSQLFSGTIGSAGSSLVFNSTSLAAFTAGVAYSYPLIATGGYTPYTWAVSSGTLPTGVSLNTSTGVLSGTLGITTGSSSYNFSISITDASSQIQTRAFNGTVAANPASAVSIISTNLNGIAVGSVTTGISTSGGVAPLTFSVQSGALPTGLTLNTSTGVISGTIPIAQANVGYAVAIKVVDAAGSNAINTFTGTISAGTSVMSLVTTTLSPFAAGIAYSYPLVVTGGVSPYTYAVASGTLPTGISLNTSTGVLSGTAGIASGGAVYSFTISVTDSASQTQSKAYSGTVATNPAAVVSITSTSLAGIAVGNVNTGISSSGGIAPLTFSVSGGALPTGLTLNSLTGAITGTIGVGLANSSYAAAITLTDSSGSTATKSFTGLVSAGSAVLTMNTTSLSSFTAGIAYSYPLDVTGGTSPYTFTISSGTLPSGISIGSSTGILSGTTGLTTGGQTYSFTVTVTDAASQTTSKSYVGTIASNPAGAIAINSTLLSGITVGAVSTGISTSGGIAPLVFTVSSGALPSGLSISSSTGLITGTIPVCLQQMRRMQSPSL